MNTPTAETARVRYVFLDIVGFTKKRSVEAQSDLVRALNKVVREAMNAVSISKDARIFLPTGDGMAIALIETGPYDIHLLLALEILRLIADHNKSTGDPMRQFEVRIGVNENVDNLVLDINGMPNVAGHGIAMAQRIMDKADGCQILVGQAVYETLRPREQYMSSFRPFNALAKHQLTFPVYQYLSEGSPGLNIDTPSAFVPRRTEVLQFDKYVAYFVAHAISNREFLVSRKGDPARHYAATVLLHFLANDSVTKSETSSHDIPYLQTWQAGAATVQEQYAHYRELEFRPLSELSSLIEEVHLARFSNYFDNTVYIKAYWLPSDSARKKCCAEFPSIAAEFGISP